MLAEGRRAVTALPLISCSALTTAKSLSIKQLASLENQLSGFRRLHGVLVTPLIEALVPTPAEESAVPSERALWPYRNQPSVEARISVSCSDISGH